MKPEKIRSAQVDVNITQLHVSVSPVGAVSVDLDLLWSIGGFPVPQSTKMLPLNKEQEKQVKALVEILTEAAYNAILPEKPNATGVPRRGE